MAWPQAQGHLAGAGALLHPFLPRQQDETGAGRPHVLIARTVFGKGVSYMESQIKWHYWPMSDEEFRRALAEIEAME